MSRLFPCLPVVLAACASVSQAQVPTPAPSQTPASRDALAETQDAGAPAHVRAATDGAGQDRAAVDRVSSSPVLGSGASDRGADADLDVARGLFDRGEQESARVALQAFVARHPNHGSRPTAEILLARLALGRGEPMGAKKLLDPLAAVGADASAETNGVARSARYYLGLAELRIGNPEQARALLLPFAKGNGGDPAPTDDAAVELRGALAEATAATDPAAALELWEGYMRAAREHEKAWARNRATEVGARLSPEVAWRAYGAGPPSGLTRAVLGQKAATYLRARGDASGAAFVETEASAARHAMGFDLAAVRVGPGDPARIGLSLPLSGKFQVVGEAVLRAAMLAAGAPGPGSGGVQLVLRDTATDAERATRGVAELTRTEAVIAIIGAAGAKTGGAAIAQATQDGIAMLALEDAAPGAPTTAFQMVHTPEARAAALARRALKLGVRRFAVLGPDSVSGKRLREAFRRAVAEGGGVVVAESSYVAGATSFAGALGPIKKSTFQAIFVPDSAERLALVAPALAVADLWPQSWSKARIVGPPGKDQPRSILLLSTANELSHKLLETGGRYVQGSLLCPGFFADDVDLRARGFVEAYRAAYAQAPHATEAYAYDAVATLRAMTQRGARTRSDVIRALGVGGGVPVLQGLTGNVTFGPDHGRVDEPLVYVVDGNDIRIAR